MKIPDSEVNSKNAPTIPASLERHSAIASTLVPVFTGRLFLTLIFFTISDGYRISLLRNVAQFHRYKPQADKNIAQDQPTAFEVMAHALTRSAVWLSSNRVGAGEILVHRNPESKA